MRRLIWEKTRVLLPLVGDRVGSLEFTVGFPLVALIGAKDTVTQLYLDSRAQIWWGTCGQEIPLPVSQDPKDFACALELLGSKVTEAFAYRKGGLWLEFDNRWSLRLDASAETPQNDWPNLLWKVNFPQPARPVGGSVAEGFIVEGYIGELLVFGG